MIIQFRTQDDSLFVLDTATELWAEVNTPAADPESKVIQNGKLIPQGFGVYALAGRKDGLRTIGTFLIPYQTTITLYVRANVEIKDLTMPVPFTEILYEVLPQDPTLITKEMEKAHEKTGTEIASGEEKSAGSGTISEVAAGEERATR